MKRIITAIIAAATWLAASAQVEISKVDRVTPTDEIFMDMAVDVARTAVDQGRKPCGAVVVLNGAWRAAGMAVGGLTAEQDAIARAQRTTLPTAAVYTINQPTTAALDALRQAQVKTVYYVNPMEDVIAAGLYTAADYAPTGVEGLPAISVVRLDYAPAAALIK